MERMANFLRLDLDMLDHPKVSRLVTRYGDRGLIGLLRLWIQAGRFSQKGTFDGLTARDLAAIAKAPGKKPEEFIEFLVALKLLDCDAETYSVHNWAKRQPFLATAEERSTRNTQAAMERWSQSRRGANGTNNKSSAGGIPTVAEYFERRQ
jgi:hypothetical protein